MKKIISKATICIILGSHLGSHLVSWRCWRNISGRCWWVPIVLLSLVGEEVNVMIPNILPLSPPLSGYLSTNSRGYLAAAQSDQQSFYLIRFILLLFIHGKVFYYIFSQIANQKLTSPNFRWGQSSSWYLYHSIPPDIMNDQMYFCFHGFRFLHILRQYWQLSRAHLMWQ